MSALIAVVGWVGAVLLVAAYALVSTGRLSGSGLQFQLLNVVGGVALTVNTAYHGAWPSAALNVVWVVVGLGALVQRYQLVSHPGGRRRRNPDRLVTQVGVDSDAGE